ncbi:MAG: hypothetical protein ACP5U1_13445 [Desulfomonilaceae bacterium]
MKTKQIIISMVLAVILGLVSISANAGGCGTSASLCPAEPGVHYTCGQCAPYLRSAKFAPWVRSVCEAPHKKSCGMAPCLKTVGEASYRRSFCEAPYIRTQGEAPYKKSCGMAPVIIRICEPPCYPPQQKQPPEPCVRPIGCFSR